MCIFQFRGSRAFRATTITRVSRLCLAVMTLAAVLCAADSVAGEFANAAPLATARYYHTASLLASGKVLVLGGVLYNSGGSHELASAELYDPASDSWSAAASMSIIRARHTVTLLPSGKFLVAGGTTG